jgi:hypothetical protein
MDTKYKGWTNYATWRVNLEIFDGMTRRDIVGNNLEIGEFKDALKEYAEELIEQSSQKGLARDYAFAFLSEVNWWEIANAMIVDEQLDEEEAA